MWSFPMTKIGWGDLAVLFWAGYFLGFWTCAVLVMLTKYGIWPRRK
jgi:hypothetical protein